LDCSAISLFWNPIILRDNIKFAFINIGVNYIYIRINRQTVVNHSYLSSFSQLNVDNFFYPQTAKSKRITYASDNSHNFITYCSIYICTSRDYIAITSFFFALFRHILSWKKSIWILDSGRCKKYQNSSILVLFALGWDGTEIYTNIIPLIRLYMTHQSRYRPLCSWKSLQNLKISRRNFKIFFKKTNPQY
jgi:hypothetical protein